MPHYTNPEGREYITGMDRRGNGQNKKTHLFDGDFSDPGLAMCQWAYDEDGGYSIWRGNISNKGICSICKRRADEGLDGVSPPLEDIPTIPKG